MAWRAAIAMGLPFHLIKATEIAQGVLSGKPPAMLLAPGGTARLKSRALGHRGREAIRRYVAGGGKYLGFCGGAGLGLSDAEGLGLCPWRRAPYTDRMQHLVSGHVLSQGATHTLAPPQRQGAEENPLLPLPVWWPGRFAPHAAPSETHGEGNAAGDADVAVLASYVRPGPDMCLADLPLNSLPGDIFGEWQALYGVNMRADFLINQPCVITGRYGKGEYVLSYSHLETPESSEANAWLAHLLRSWVGLTPGCDILPPWDVDNAPVAWPRNEETAPLHQAAEEVMRLLELGAEHHLLFRRTSWLHGWRAGIPGAACNNLHAALRMALSLAPTPQAMAFWRKRRVDVARALPLFARGVEGYLLAERLAATLAAGAGEGPPLVDRRGLKVQREALFGRPMEGGGLYQELLDVAEELVFLGARHQEEAYSESLFSRSTCTL